MSTWTSDELQKIGNAEELQIASLQPDGMLRRAVTIWVVRVGNDLYVRSVYGRGSGWFSGVQTRYQGHIRAGGVDKAITFIEEADEGVNEQIDNAYRTKYGRYAASIVNTTLTPEARAAMIKLVPLDR